MVRIKQRALCVDLYGPSQNEHHHMESHDTTGTPYRYSMRLGHTITPHHYHWYSIPLL